MEPSVSSISKIENFDLEKSEQSFEIQGAKKKIAIAKFKTDGKPTVLSLVGEVCTNGICVNEFTNGIVYSLGFRFLRDEDLTHFMHFNEVLEEFITDEYTCTNIVKDETIYLKLKLSNDKKTFLTKSNKKIDPKKPADFPSSGDEVTVTVAVTAYFNHEEKKCGLVLVLKSLDFI